MNFYLKIGLIFLFLSIISFLNIYLHLNEGFDVPILSNISDAFCQSNTGAALEKACNNLTQGNCGRTSCCVWTSDGKCKAGNTNGPTFNTNALNYYYFEGKCYGSMCKNE